MITYKISSPLNRSFSIHLSSTINNLRSPLALKYWPVPTLCISKIYFGSVWQTKKVKNEHTHRALCVCVISFNVFCIYWIYIYIYMTYCRDHWSIQSKRLCKHFDSTLSLKAYVWSSITSNNGCWKSIAKGNINQTGDVLKPKYKIKLLWSFDLSMVQFYFKRAA